MRIYIDEDLASSLLVHLLKIAGHEVNAPAGVGMLGRSDPEQFTFAIRENRVCLTANHNDFDQLHLLVRQARGIHPGVMVVRQENDPTRDLTPKGIVAAIRRLEASGVPIENEIAILNHWR